MICDDILEHSYETKYSIALIKKKEVDEKGLSILPTISTDSRVMQGL